MVTSSPKPGANGVIEVIRFAGRQMESAPRAFEAQNEEALRMTLLVAINGATKGAAVAEASNMRGKTDILVRRDGVNEYLAECKLYGGPKGLSEAIDQLLGYTGWREREVGLIVFVRKTKMSTAIAAAREALADHPKVREISEIDPTGSELRATAQHPQDSEVELEITVQLFYLPIPRDREELVGGVLADHPERLTQMMEARGVPAGEGSLAYQRYEGESDHDLPRRPNAMARVERITPEGRVAIDAVALDSSAIEHYGPRGTIELPDDEAHLRMRRALHDNVAVDLPGAKLRFDRLPPLFRPAAEEIADADPDHVTIRISPRGLWQCRMQVETDRGELTVPMAFAQIEPMKKGEVALRGSFYDLWLTLRVSPGEEPSLAWEHAGSDSPIRERLASLDFLYALSGAGEIRWESIDPPALPPVEVITERDELPPDVVAERRFLADLTLLEDYLEVGFELPDEVDPDGVADIFTAAETVRTGRAKLRIENLSFMVARRMLAEGDEIEYRGPIPVDVLILGLPFKLGYAQGHFRGRVATVTAVGREDKVTLVPADKAAAAVEVSDLRPPAA